MEKKFKTLSSALLLTALYGCGGGGGSDDSTTETTTPPVTTTPEPTLVMPVGVWAGDIVVTENSEQLEVVGLVAADGEFRFIREDEQQFTGTITLTDETNFTADGIGFDSDGLKLADGEFKGAYSDVSISGDTIFNNEVISTFDLSLLDITSADSGFNVIAGNYVDADGTTSVMIDDDGAISGSDSLGCQYTGAFTHADESVNVYSLSLTVSSCGEFDGEYSGLATYGKAFSDVPVGLIFQGSNAAYSLTNILFKS